MFAFCLFKSAVKFPLISKTGAILGLNIVLTVATVSTFLGTFYPMLFQAMNWGSISVGAPYFNSIFLPLLTLVLFAMAGTLGLGWFKADKKHFFKRLLLLIPAAVIAYGMIWNALQNDGALRFHFFAYILLTLAIWVLFVTLWQNWAKVRLAYFGMILAHCGVAIATMGAVMSSYFGSELGVRLAPQQSQQLGQFEFHYDRFSNEIYHQVFPHMGVQIHSVQPNTTTCTTAYPQYNLVSFLKLLPSNIPMIDCLSTVFFHYQNTVHHICPFDDKFLRILFHDSANKKQLLSKPP